MSAPIKTDPPYVPIRTGGWPVRRSPRWLIPAAVVLVGIAVAVGLAHHPSRQERATDMHGLLYAVTYDVDSCVGSLHDSLNALQAIDSGASKDTATAVSVASGGAANCSPANNELIDDLENYQVPESLASFHLQNAVTGLIDWSAPDAERAQVDIARVLTARGSPAEAGDLTALRGALRTLDAQRAAVDKALAPAIRSLTPGAAAPALPG
jgi:hypothetical protein